MSPTTLDGRRFQKAFSTYFLSRMFPSMLGGLRYVCPDTNAGLVLRGLRLKGSGELRLSGGRWGHYPPGWRIVKRKKQEPILSGDHSVLHRHRIWLPAAKFRSLDLASLEASDTFSMLPALTEYYV